MGLGSRLVKAVGQVANTGAKYGPRVIENVVKPAGGKVGDLIALGMKGGIRAGAAGASGVLKLFQANEGHNLFKKAGSLVGSTHAEAHNLLQGTNKIAGTLTGGVAELKGYNKALNKTIGKITKNDYTGHRFGALLTNSEDAVLFGKKATTLGTGVAVVGAAIGGATTGIKEANKIRMGQSAGVASNAPINGYATMGNAYANNGGATGDLVFALHDKRKSGFL